MAFTPKEQKQQNRAMDTGQVVGGGLGAYSALKANRGIARGKAGVAGGKAGFGLGRDLGSSKGSSLAAAVRASAAGIKAKPMVRAPILGMAAAGAAGAIGGGALAENATKKKQLQKRPGAVMKSDPFNIEKLSDKEKRGLIGGAVGGVFGPPGSAIAAGSLAPKGKKGRYAALGAAGGLGGPVGSAATGYLAATAKKPKIKKSDSTSAFGVDHA